MKDFALLIKLGVCALAVILLGDVTPEPIQMALYTASLAIKDTLVFFLPFVIFAFIFSCLAAFQKGAPALVGILLFVVVVSNFLYTQAGFFMGDWFLPDLQGLSKQAPNDDELLKAYFLLPWPSFITTDMALLLGTLSGMLAAFLGSQKLLALSIHCKNKVQWALSRFFIPVIPVYILGFLIKIQHDGSLVEMITGYAPVFLLIILAQLMGTVSWFLMAAKGNLKQAWIDFRACLPAGVVGFSTMSSAATMPVTLEVAEKQSENKSLTQVVVPATANIHLVADSVTIPILLLAVYSIFGFEPMTYSGFLYFCMFYMVSKFAVAAVPGGGLLVLLPMLEAQFGFTSPMIGLITALYILLDPFLTGFNVFSNAGLALTFDRTIGKLPFMAKAPKKEETLA